MAQKSLNIVSKLPTKEVISRLREAVDTPDLSLQGVKRLFDTTPPPSKRSAIGWINPDSILICKRLGYRNSFQTYLNATVTPCAEGTKIVGKFGMHPYMQVATMAWLGGLFLIGGYFLLRDLYANNSWAAFLIAIVCVGSSALVVYWGRYRAREEQEFLVRFLSEILQVERA